ncbi:hypothetical protein KY290_027397 [Solanum tuberosum]|uniref:Uncharacterized protein n=1 Tax=Solanum tuberosum TaxID=4113 RepID=A0ABQ7UI68_SOLTU|nr:hypothetical protein KY290_027397 [Solanum tuberosum]
MKAAALKLALLNEVYIRGAKVDISKTEVNKFMHGLECTTPTIVLYEVRHRSVTSELEMSNLVPREQITRWIVGLITTDGQAASWVANPKFHITKASLSFPAKVRWVIVRAQLRPTGNDNTLSLS